MTETNSADPGEALATGTREAPATGTRAGNGPNSTPSVLGPDSTPSVLAGDRRSSKDRRSSNLDGISLPINKSGHTSGTQEGTLGRACSDENTLTEKVNALGLVCRVVESELRRHASWSKARAR